jgi:hypothetical protein
MTRTVATAPSDARNFDISSDPLYRIVSGISQADNADHNCGNDAVHDAADAGVWALYFRFYETDVRLRPGWKWDVALFVSSLALFVASSWGIYSTFWDFVGQIRKSLLT